MVGRPSTFVQVVYVTAGLCWDWLEVHAYYQSAIHVVYISHPPSTGPAPWTFNWACARAVNQSLKTGEKQNYAPPARPPPFLSLTHTAAPCTPPARWYHGVWRGGRSGGGERNQQQEEED